MIIQREEIYNYMKQYGGITQLEATTMLGCTRLSGRIKDMRDRGINVLSVWREGKTRQGRKCRYVEYKLADRDPGHVSGAE